jgi:DNA processing protein
MDRKIAYILLNMIPEIGPTRFKNIYLHFNGKMESLFDANIDEISNIEDIGENIAQKILSAKNNIDIEKELKLIEKYNVKVITFDDEEYPLPLRGINFPPFVLYVRGEFKEKDNIAIAVVGTRRPSSYGCIVAEKIVKDLVDCDITIVSGLARGIDTQAHRTAISCKGRTIAVLGNGIDVYYPPENRKLQDTIPSYGAIITEFPMSTPPNKSNFPQRNRLIAGLALGVLVVEADIKSGALITAKYSIEQGKDVFAVPGSILSTLSRGPHMLIKQGAKLVETAEDIIEEISPLREFVKQSLKRKKEQVADTATVPLSEDERKVFEIFPETAVNLEFLIEASKVEISRLMEILLSLEMKGFIKALPGKMYQRTTAATT